MCCCASPNVNGTMGYSWTGKGEPGVRPVDPPTLNDGEQLAYDEPGRCGGLDCHSHHYRVTAGARAMLLVKHGGGEERIRLSNAPQVLAALACLDSNGRYWMLSSLYYATHDARCAGRDAIDRLWRQAAAEKRIKVRKVRNSDRVRVEITQATP